MKKHIVVLATSMKLKKKGLTYASLLVVAALSGMMGGCGTASDTPVSAATTTTFVYTSDAHYGLKRAAFSGMSSAQQVNGAMIAEMNRLQSANVALPSDGGINAGQTLSAVDFVVETGDITHRSEGTVYPYKNAPASAVWPYFVTDYLTTLNLKDRSGAKAPLYLTAGNHDIYNAIGYYKAPLDTAAGLDATSYVNIYNLMMKPATALTNSAFVGVTPSFATAASSYASNRVYYSKDINGVHFVFISMWPDSTARAWIDNDLKTVSATTPVMLFTHDQPNIETKHLTNPNGTKNINSTDKFENLVTDIAASTAITGDSNVEQRALVAWLKTHKNIVAYFHGNDHINGTYTYTGPDNDISLNVIRVDSPMKGILADGSNGSNTNPSLLAFKVMTIDAANQKLTVRDYMWNTKTWGTTTNLSLALRSL
jgi:hypothetical protein